MNARSMAFARVCGCVLACFLALPFAAEEAKAQTAECAQFDVFTPSAGEVNPATSVNPWNLSGTLAEIVSSLMTALPSSISHRTYFHFGDTPNAPATEAERITGGLPVFDVSGSERTVMEGDIITLQDLLNAANFGTFRVYENAAGALALGEEQAAKKCEADLTGNEFFLTDGYAETTTAAATNIGFVALTDSDCNGDRTADADGLMCELICAAGMMEDPDNSDMCIDTGGGGENEMPETPATGTTTAADESDNDISRYLIGGGLVLAMFAIATGDASDFALSPDYGYSLTESGYSVNAGGRVDFRKDRWHLYWTAGQESVNGDFGDFRYSSGGEYKADIWTATFSESVQGETADYDISLSANWTGGIWKVSPAFAIDSVYEKGEFATTNSFRINGEMQVDDWRLSASGNQTQMELSAVLEF